MVGHDVVRAALAGDVPWLDAADIADRVAPPAAAAAIRLALEDGLDPAAQPARTAMPTAAGQVLLMPAEHAGHVGVKLATVAPGNPRSGLPRIQAVYVLFDAATLSPVALLDGTALTTLRTPAVSAVAVERLTDTTIERLVVIGSGPQGLGHILTLTAVRDIAEVVLVARDPSVTAARVSELADEGHPVRAGTISDIDGADLVVCATTASTPLFDADLVSDRACVIAVGSHTPDARELDPALLRRAAVVVEDRATALREAGDVALAVAEGALTPGELVELGPLVRGHAEVPINRPRVVKTVGMAWQDLVVATAVIAAG